MTREELIAHFKQSTVPPDVLWQDGSVDLATEVVYSLLPLNHDPITEYDNLIKGKTAIAFGFSNNEKRFLQRHIKKYGGNFRFTKNNKEDFFIVHPSTWIYDMLYALRRARENGAIIVDFDDFSNIVGEHFSDEVEQKRKMQEREETRKKWLKGLGFLVAMSVILLLIWETGLLIPLGLIGLATSGLFKRFKLPRQEQTARVES